MSRDFALSMMFGMVLFFAEKSFYFIHFKIPAIVMTTTFILGFISVRYCQSLPSLMGFALAYFVGSYLDMHSNYSLILGLSPGFELRETTKLFLLENNNYALWLIGFPSGFYLRPYITEILFSRPRRRTSRRPKEFGTIETRPRFLSLRDQPSELSTSPSIRLN